MTYAKSDNVVAICDIDVAGGAHIPKGSVGVVTEAGLFIETKVVFTLAGFVADRKVEAWINSNEVATLDPHHLGAVPPFPAPQDGL
jgi:hypothetical protein